jgi:alkanesulfonate monooxygenase SsuD/methylene tetrahydromethanopterin reductase-like flavin-dependent oxidoreductase (luciferase family)
VPVGLGAVDDLAFGNVGEPVSARERAALLDESLAIVAGLLTGEPFGFGGSHYRFGPMTFRPLPVQRPHPPVWVVGIASSERSLARAFDWQGIVTQGASVEELRAFADRARPGFDIVVDGVTDPDDPGADARVEALAGAGATWWIEANWDRPTVEGLRARILAGPPRRLATQIRRPPPDPV